MPSVAGESTGSPDGKQSEASTQPSGLSNGERKTSDFTWGVNDMRQNATEWSLASDASLLKFLQEFSSRLTLKAHESTQGINNLVHDTRMTDSKLRNVTDRFLTLSDSQFIENRVYDEDVSNDTAVNGSETNPSVDSKENADANQETDLTPKLSEAIGYGIKVLDEAFDILDGNAANSDYDSDMDSDAEEGDATNGMPETEGIYEAKDPYVTRPLPHLIGSRGFHETEDVGVADIPSEDELLDDQGSMSESEEEEDEGKPQKKEEVSSSSEYDTDLESSESEDEAPKRKSTQVSRDRSGYSSESDEDKDLFGHASDGEDSLSDAPAPAAKKPASKPKKHHKQEEEKDLFQNDEEDEEDLFGASGGLFGAGSNLFTKKKSGGGLFGDVEDAEEEEDEDSEKQEEDSQKLSSDEADDEDEKEEKEEKKPSKPAKKTYGGISLFGGAVNKEIFKKIRKDDGSEDRSRTGSQVSVQSSKKSLFESSDEDEGDLFRSQPPPVSKPSPASSKSSKKETKSLFESSDESEDEKAAPPPKKKTTLAPAAKKKASDLFASDSDDEGDLFSASVASSKDTKSKKGAIPPKKGPVSSTKKAAVKLSSSDDDGLFSSKPPPSKAAPKKDTSTKKAPVKMISSDDDDDMFASKPPPDATAKSAPKKGLFDDDSDDDFFSSKPTKPKAKKEISIFSESDSDDMFSSIPKSKQKPAPSKPTSHPSKLKSPSGTSHESGSLFADPEPAVADENDEESPEDLPPKEEPPKKKLAGAVPMFMGALGGSELAAAIGKRRADSEVSTKSSASSKTEPDDLEKTGKPEKEEKQEPTLPKPRTSSGLQNASAKPFQPPQLGNASAKPFKPSVIHAPKPSQTPSKPPEKKVGALGAKLAIDPKRLLPGAAPKPAPVVETEISFDKPPVMRTLDSVNKTRSRGQAKRRPPSRHMRRSLVDPMISIPTEDPVAPVSSTPPPIRKKVPKAAEKSGALEKPEPTKEKAVPKSASPTPLVTAVTPPVVKKSPRAENENVVKASKSEENEAVAPVQPATKPVAKIDDGDDFDAELFSGSLFSSSKKSSEKQEKPTGVDIFGDDEDEADLFGITDEKKAKGGKAKEAHEGDLFSDSSATKRAGAKVPPKLFSDDDIFGDIDFMKTAEKKTAKETKKEDDIFGDDGDLDFLLPSSPSKNKKAESENLSTDIEKETASSKTKSDEPADIFGDDADIFGQNVTVEESAKSKPSKVADVFADDGDIFGGETVVKAPAPVTKTTEKSKKGGLFADDNDGEDIFAAAPKKESASGKAKKSTKKQTKAAKEKSIFDDDDNLDDIFLSSASKKTTKKKKDASKSGAQSKKAAKPKPAETTSTDIFDDPLSMP